MARATFPPQENGMGNGTTLEGKTVIVTGGGRDIGRACALRLARDGANVAINYHASAAGADSAVRHPRPEY